MAYQTSKILQEHSTPRSIGRLMDADFFGGRQKFLGEEWPAFMR
jgi:hypothetical protein